MPSQFQRQLRKLELQQSRLLNRRNPVEPGWYNGVVARHQNPVMTQAQARPLLLARARNVDPESLRRHIA